MSKLRVDKLSPTDDSKEIDVSSLLSSSDVGVGFAPGKLVASKNESGSAVLTAPSDNGTSVILRKDVTTPNDSDSFQIRRIASYTGGKKGFVGAALRVISDTVSTGTNYEWSIVGIVNNNSPAGVENVGVYGQGNMKSSGGTWGGCFEACDMSYGDNQGKGELVGCEVDCYFNGPDTESNRYGLQVIAGDAKYNRTGNAGEVGTATYGIRVASQPGGAANNFVAGVVVASATVDAFQANSTGQRALHVLGSYGVGVETYGATLTGPALRAGAGQAVSFTQDDRVNLYSTSDALIAMAGNIRSTVTESSAFRPFVDGRVTLGTAPFRFGTIYSTSSAISTSDGNLKTDVRVLSEKENAVAKEIKGLIRAFKFTEAMEIKGEKSRIHFGVIAQDVKAAFERQGLSADDYGLFCYDEWKAEDPVMSDGVIIYPGQSAGSRYGIRYEELLCFMIASL